MAKYYTLVPLPEGIFDGVPLIDRAVFGLIWERWRLSSYNVAGGKNEWIDPLFEDVFCVYSHDELARQIGASEKTIRRALIDLRDEYGFITWRKASYKGSCRYFVEPGVCEYMSARRHDNMSDTDRP